MPSQLTAAAPLVPTDGRIHVGHYAMGSEVPVAVKQHIQKVGSESQGGAAAFGASDSACDDM